MLDQVALAYGGLDAIAVTAGIFVVAGHRGAYPGRAVGRDLRDQRDRAVPGGRRGGAALAGAGPAGSLVLTTSANAAVAKKGSLAYDTSKAAANHLVRELAIELAPLVRVNGVAPATVVQGSAMFPRERVIASLAKYAIPTRRRADRGADRQACPLLRRPHAAQAPDHPA